ncbi:hypothetical protein VP01_3301g2 [Puccinia sorghi]|uniref:Uncharacterized protein n=1 Tax=Puccinia sorghi TaxID=27349 RepID=A0A0L6UZ97_9BASI|nr:hypothetical protein VP01_3301g2 [Puccinia sorghi]
MEWPPVQQLPGDKIDNHCGLQTFPFNKSHKNKSLIIMAYSTNEQDMMRVQYSIFLKLAVCCLLCFIITYDCFLFEKTQRLETKKQIEDDKRQLYEEMTRLGDKDRLRVRNRLEMISDGLEAKQAIPGRRDNDELSLIVSRHRCRDRIDELESRSSTSRQTESALDDSAETRRDLRRSRRAQVRARFQQCYLLAVSNIFPVMYTMSKVYISETFQESHRFLFPFFLAFFWLLLSYHPSQANRSAAMVGHSQLRNQSMSSMKNIHPNGRKKCRFYSAKQVHSLSTPCLMTAKLKPSKNELVLRFSQLTTSYENSSSFPNQSTYVQKKKKNNGLCSGVRATLVPRRDL